MIELSGLTLGRDINIKITGLRPGEKLHEELMHDINSCEKTQNKKIYIAKIREENVDIEKGLQDLKRYLMSFDRKKLVKKLKELVPTYKDNSYSEENIDGRQTKYSVIST